MPPAGSSVGAGSYGRFLRSNLVGEIALLMQPGQPRDHPGVPFPRLLLGWWPRVGCLLPDVSDMSNCKLGRCCPTSPARNSDSASDTGPEAVTTRLQSRSGGSMMPDRGKANLAGLVRSWDGAMRAGSIIERRTNGVCGMHSLRLVGPADAPALTGAELLRELAVVTDDLLTLRLPEVPLTDPLRGELEDLASRYRGPGGH